MVPMNIPPAWAKAMARAAAEGLQCVQTRSGAYAVPSTTRIGTFHIVSLDEKGRIIDCSDCMGWLHGGRERPCKHSGAVSLRLLREYERRLEAHEAAKSRSDRADPVIVKGNIFQSEEVA